MLNKTKGKLVFGWFAGTAAFVPVLSNANVVERGLSPPANTYQSYQNASINRDSGNNQPLNLLNDFYPSIEVTVSDHDNVRRRTDVDESDLLFTVSPALGYRTNFGRHQFYAAYQGNFTFHQDIDQEDAESNALNAKLGLDLSRRWDLELFGGLGRSFEERGVSGSREFTGFRNNGFDSGPEQVDYVSYGADLIFGRKIGIFQAVLGFDHNETSFDSDDLAIGSNFADSRDRESDSIHLDLNWQFSDKTSLFGRAQITDIDYDRADTFLDSTQTDYLVGLRWKPANSLSGTVGVGVSDKDFDDPARTDFDGGIYYGNLNYSINPFSVISLSASRTVEEPGGEIADFYESELLGIGWDHALSPLWAIGLYAKGIDDDFESGRQDKFFDWGAELSYLWKDWLTASIYYGEIERDSSRDEFDYEDQYIGLRLRSDLRSLFGSSNDSQKEPELFGKPKKTNRTKRTKRTNSN